MRTIKNKDQLKTYTLQEDDIVIFNIDGKKVTYDVYKEFLCLQTGVGNDIVFRLLGFSVRKKEMFAKKIYGYHGKGDFPMYKNMKDATKIVIALYDDIEKSGKGIQKIEEVEKETTENKKEIYKLKKELIKHLD